GPTSQVRARLILRRRVRADEQNEPDVSDFHYAWHHAPLPTNELPVPTRTIAKKSASGNRTWLDSTLLQLEYEVSKLFRLVPAMRDVQHRHVGALRQSLQDLDHAAARLLIQRTQGLVH